MVFLEMVLLFFSFMNILIYLLQFFLTLTFLQQLIKSEKQFAEGEDAKKNKSTLLRIFIDLAPKPKNNYKNAVLDVVRATMKLLADDCI